MEHVNAQITQVVVMYRSAEEVIRPSAPTDVSVWKGIMWCKACSRLRGRGLGSQSSGPDLLVTGCTRTNQTVWAEDQFTVTSSYSLTKCGQLTRRLTCGLDTFGSANLGRFLVA